LVRRVQIAVLALVAAAAGAWWWSSQHPHAPAAWQGYAEADYVRIAPTQQGLLTAVFVARGDAVAAGAPLFVQDETADRAARDQAELQLAQAEQQLSNLQASGKPTEIQQAEANLADARATLVRATADYARGEALIRTGVVSAQNFDQLQAEYHSAAARVHALEAALAQARAPMGRDWEIAAQRAAVGAARAAVEMAEWRLGQRRVAAPAAGRIADVFARQGETVAAGTPVVSLLPPENIFVRFFISETALSKLHKGDPVAFACDGCPAGLSGTVSFISPQAEYTPPLIYSDTSRAKLVYLIEARPPRDQAARLNPGQPVAVRPAASRAGAAVPR
jgi:HlyD family secretion protein